MLEQFYITWFPGDEKHALLQPSSEVPSSVQSGFVFRENKFAADPTLPFGSLAMPAFEKVGTT